VGGEPLVEVVRSGFAESRHLGSVAVLGPDGEPVAWAGDITGAILPRSANKPLQAAGMLRCGLVVTPAELALVAASHRGFPKHIALVRQMLRSADLDESALGNVADYPLADGPREDVIRAGGRKSPVLMNCSGKHAGMLRTCLANDWPLDSYLDAEHPLQRSLTSTLADLAGEDVPAVAVDGCGAPAHALSLRGLALSFLRLVSAGEGTPERAVADAMRAYPELVSGPDADAADTHLMAGVSGLISKGGAEGVIAVAAPGVGAVAVKIDDGAYRARLPVLVAALRRLGVEAPILDEYAEPPVLGGGRPVGVIRALANGPGRGRAAASEPDRSGDAGQ
jgi:L-asparaginase II